MKTFFIHVPKCGGSSVDDKITTANIKYFRFNHSNPITISHIKLLDNPDNPPETPIWNTYNPKNNDSGFYGGHCQYEYLEKLGMDFKYYATVRHPLHRAISFYNYIIQRESMDPQFEEVQKLSLSQYVLRCENEMCIQLFAGNYKKAKQILQEKYLFVGNIDYPKQLDYMTNLLIGKTVRMPSVNVGSYPVGKYLSSKVVSEFEKRNQHDYELYNMVGKYYIADKKWFEEASRKLAVILTPTPEDLSYS